MRLIGLRIQNYRSIVDSGDMRIEPLQILVGENNSGKSNILKAIQVFLTPGAGGVEQTDFFDPNQPMILTATFGELSASERKQLRPYLLGDRLILEKRIVLEEDKRSGRSRPKAEYHGYHAKPKDWWLTTEGVIEQEGSRPNWERIASDHGIIDYVRDESGRVTRSSYETGLARILVEREDIEFEEPSLGDTQALGLQPVLLDKLPVFRILPAITDYSDEIDKRSSSTNFRLLMGDLADRILKADPRYQRIETNLKHLTCLLNAPQPDEQRDSDLGRLVVLEHVERKLQEIISKLMPSVRGVRVSVDVEEIRDLFSRGVSIQIDDGKLTEVMMKGHGLQRCVVFGLLQALILNQRGQLIDLQVNQRSAVKRDERTIILAIEEPELYIHPQMQRLIFGVLRDFAKTDQVIYSTHSPAFVDIANYQSIAVIRKESVSEGTKVKQCGPGVLDAATEKKTSQFLSSFGLEQNSMFFAKKVVLVEGKEDIIAVLATGREVGLFEFPEELGYTLIATGSKQEMPKYMKLLNAFGIPYVVLLELDGQPSSDENQRIRDLVDGNRIVELDTRLEDIVGHSGHFKKTYDAMRFFENRDNITDPIRNIVRQLFS